MELSRSERMPRAPRMQLGGGARVGPGRPDRTPIVRHGLVWSRRGRRWRRDYLPLAGARPGGRAGCAASNERRRTSDCASRPRAPDLARASEPYRPRGSGRDDGAPRAQVALHEIAEIPEDAFQLVLRRWCVVVAARVKTVADHLPLTGLVGLRHVGRDLANQRPERDAVVVGDRAGVAVVVPAVDDDLLRDTRGSAASRSLFAPDRRNCGSGESM